MILIISEHQDKITTAVVEWLVANKKTFVRIDFEDKISIRAITLNNNNEPEIAIEGFNYGLNLASLTSVWHRRALQILHLVKRS